MAGNEQAISVTTLNEYVDSLLANDVRLRSIKVQGEISALKLQYSSGHIYFTLKDENASIRCVMFKSRAAMLRFEPKDGINVIVSGRVEVYSPSGQYTFNITSMHEAGDGDLYKRFLETRDKLASEGLFDRKRSIPKLPRCVGIITSDSGAAFHDIVNVITRRFPTMDMVFAPATVQGKEAPASLINALDAINDDGRADVIIIGRGGGSYDELSCFNDEVLARSIYQSRIPTISAVGHEIDYTITDFVADLRAPTPSAAAEICVPVLSELLESLGRIKETLTARIGNSLNAAAKHIEYCSSLPILRDSGSMFTLKQQKLNEMCSKINNAIEFAIASGYSKLETRSSSLEALNPRAVIKRGYALIRNAEGHYVPSASELTSGDRIAIIFADGSVSAAVTDSREHKD